MLFTCRDYVYEAGRKITVVKEDFFDNQPWYVRLILEGEDRLCRNREVREHNNCISYSHISEGWCELVDKRQNVLEKLIIEEAIGEFMDLLTDRQRQVIHQMDGTSGDVIIEIAYENHPVKGELNIVKQGKVLNGYKDDFTYQKETLEGAVFEMYAAEDIYTADFQKDDNGNRILEYASGELVGTVTTDKDGKAQITDLPLGTYCFYP